MGAYLDRLNAQFDEIRTGIDELVNRAAEENRDVTDDEQKRVDRDKSRMDELTAAISHYTEIEEKGEKVSALRSKVPARQTVTVKESEPEYDLAREFPTPGDYAITVHRAQMLRDPDARERLERATAHQKTTDNPGLIPRPILGPVINILDSARPFVQSCTRRGLPAGAFDRPVVSQHVLVAEQAAEKDLTASQTLHVDKLPVTAKTFAGHLNISRQDIKWSSPGILNIVFDDFAAIYARTTCDYASDAFVASVTNAAIPVGATVDGPAVTKALYKAAVAALNAGTDAPDTMWVSPDVWGALGGLSNANSGLPAFPGLSPTGQDGNPLGFRMVVDAHFAAGTFIVGPAARNEFYEDIDGLLQVQEPDVLGQLVGYAGFCAYVNSAPSAFNKITATWPTGEETEAASSSSGSTSKTASSSGG